MRPGDYLFRLVRVEGQPDIQKDKPDDLTLGCIVSGEAICFVGFYYFCYRNKNLTQPSMTKRDCSDGYIISIRTSAADHYN